MTRPKLATVFILIGVPIVLALIVHLSRADEPTDKWANVAVIPKAEYGEYLVSHETIRAMHAASNEVRKRAGKAPHKLNAKLTLAAQDHATYMAATHTMDHYNNGGYQGRAVRHGYRGWVMENIAMGQGSVASAMSTWENSGGHYAAIVSNSSEAGFGCQRSANGTWFWCMVVGTETK